MATNQRSYNVTWILSVLLGHFGVDRFYLGKIGTGILKLITGGGGGIWYLIDIVIILAGRMTDKEGRALAGYQQYKYLSWIIVFGWWAIALLLGLLAGVVAFWIAVFSGIVQGHPFSHLGQTSWT